VLALSLCACHDGGAGGGAASATRNTGFAAEALIGRGELWLVLARESDGSGDANGDGDELDLVGHVLDRAREVLLSPGLALARADGPAPLAACDGVTAAFAVDEAAQGGADLNGDGDALDRVLFVLDRAHGTARSLGRAVSALEVGAPLVACAVDEAADGARDLDNDGDASGTVLGVLDERDGSFTEFTLRDSAPLAVADGRVALRLAEADGLDLNLDGDDEDTALLEVYDGRTRLLQNTRLVLASSAVTAVGGVFGVAVSEAAQGRGDLSGDGDADDAVFHVYDPVRAFSVNLGLVVPLHPPPAVDGARFLLHALERPSGADWNGDGDLDDLVVHVFESEPGLLYGTGMASAAAAVLLGGWVGVSVSEAMQGSGDLDGDGEASGDVVHVIELESGALRNLGVDALELAGSATQLFLAPLPGSAAPAAAGGDPAAGALYAWSPPDVGVRLVGDGVVRVIEVQGDHALVHVARDEHGLALELVDARTGTHRPLGLAAGRVARLTSELWVLALVDESAVGADLNRDGDLADEVLHLVAPAGR
jgi:hypothetical protein